MPAHHISLDLEDCFGFRFHFFRVLGIYNFDLKQKRRRDDTECLKSVKMNANGQLGFC